MATVDVGTGEAVAGAGEVVAGVFCSHMLTIWETETAGQPLVDDILHSERPEAKFIMLAALQQAWDGVMATKVGHPVTSPQTASKTGVTGWQTVFEHLLL